MLYEYIMSILAEMPTSVHIPPTLLHAVDRRAAQLQVSRNRFIIQALQQALAEHVSWSSQFLDALGEPLPSGVVDELLETIQLNRSSKGPVRL